MPVSCELSTFKSKIKTFLFKHAFQLSFHVCFSSLLFIHFFVYLFTLFVILFFFCNINYITFITISTDCKALWITKRKVLYVYIIIIIVIIIKCDSVTYN